MRLSAALVAALVAGPAAAACPYAGRSDAPAVRGCPYAERAAKPEPVHAPGRRQAIEGKKGIMYSEYY
jgi:hypothetical protein